MQKKMIRSVLIPTLLALALVSVGCRDKSEKAAKHSLSKGKEKVITAKTKDTKTRLYYSGILEPIKKVAIIAPVDGSIVKVLFKYGEAVKKGQELVVLNSEQLAEDYRKAITDFLTKKETYESGIKVYAGEKALHEAGVVSDEDYTSAKNTYDSNALSYFQSQLDLEKVLVKAGVSFKEIENLTLSTPEVIKSILRRHFNDIIVRSPGDGIVLFPGGNDDEGKSSDKSKLMVGGDVKSGEIMLTLGDLSGFASTVKVSEVNINRMKLGLKTRITGNAFPGIVLDGQVSSIASQANPSSGDDSGSISMFNLVVQVDKVTPQQLEKIHVGMTAKIEIDIDNGEQVFLPIDAVFQKDGKNKVTVIDPKTGQKTEVDVTTGNTTMDEVAIIQGVKPGDQVVMHD